MLKQIIGATLIAITMSATASETLQQEIDRIITEICTMQGSAAFAVMGARQSGAPMSSALKASDPIFVEITKGAWEYQRWASPAMRHEEMINYRDKWEAKCYKKYENE